MVLSFVAVYALASEAASSTAGGADVGDVASLKKQEKKAAKKVRRKERKAGMTAVPEGSGTDTDNGAGTDAEEGKSKAEVNEVNLAKLTIQMEVAKMVDAKKWTREPVDGCSAAEVAMAPPPPPNWSAEEEGFVKSRQKKLMTSLHIDASRSNNDASDNNAFGEEGEKKRSKYICNSCGVDQVQSEFLLESSDGTFKDSSFGGRLWGTCFGCTPGYEGDKKAFKKACEAAMTQRKISLGERWEKVRDIVFKKSRAAISLRFPHLTNTQARKLAVARLEMLVTCLGAAFLKAEPAVQKAMTICTQQYMHEVQEGAKDPTTVTSVPREEYIAGTWLTEVAEGLWLSWTCRQRACRWFGGNHMWIKNIRRERYRCPSCGSEYAPFKIAPNLHNCQKALTVRCPLSGECTSFGAKWPNNEEDSWLTRMVLIRAKALNAPTGTDLTQWMQSTAVGLSDLLARVSLPAHWERRTLTQEVIWKLDPTTYPRTQWAHLETEGYVGDVLPPEAVEQPYEEWEELISLFARTVVAAQGKLGL